MMFDMFELLGALVGFAEANFENTLGTCLEHVWDIIGICLGNLSGTFLTASYQVSESLLSVCLSRCLSVCLSVRLRNKSSMENVHRVVEMTIGLGVRA